MTNLLAVLSHVCNLGALHARTLIGIKPLASLSVLCSLPPISEFPMKLALVLLISPFVLAGCATGLKEEDHAAHHPPGAAAAAPEAPTPGQMDSMMKSMQEMHDKMMAAKTPEERAKLMQEHMKLMQDGMAMMGQMRAGKGGMGMRGMGGEKSMGTEMMGKRMDMMEMMMQMMMDREGMKPPATR